MAVLRFFSFSAFLLAISLTPGHAVAQADAGQRWESAPDHLSMDAPAGWLVMDDAVLGIANAQVLHLTGNGFIGGYLLSTDGTLLFPYMLLQYKPYTDLPAQLQPTTKLDPRQRIDLLANLTYAFRTGRPAPKTDDMQELRLAYETDRYRLIDLKDDRVDFAGTIPIRKPKEQEAADAEQDSAGDNIYYHTHCVLGKAGVGFVTVFSNYEMDRYQDVINGAMRTLAFDPASTYADLPDMPAPQPQAQPGPAPQAPPDATAHAQPAPAQAPAPDTPAQSNGTVLAVILGLMGLIMVTVTAIALICSHNKAKARHARAMKYRTHIAPAQSGRPSDAREKHRV